MLTVHRTLLSSSEAGPILGTTAYTVGRFARAGELAYRRAAHLTVSADVQRALDVIATGFVQRVGAARVTATGRVPTERPKSAARLDKVLRVKTAYVRDARGRKSSAVALAVRLGLDELVHRVESAP